MSNSTTINTNLSSSIPYINQTENKLNKEVETQKIKAENIFTNIVKIEKERVYFESYPIWGGYPEGYEGSYVKGPTGQGTALIIDEKDNGSTLIQDGKTYCNETGMFSNKKEFSKNKFVQIDLPTKLSNSSVVVHSEVINIDGKYYMKESDGNLPYFIDPKKARKTAVNVVQLIENKKCYLVTPRSFSINSSQIFENHSPSSRSTTKDGRGCRLFFEDALSPSKISTLRSYLSQENMGKYEKGYLVKTAGVSNDFSPSDISKL